jgi:hypothetical protein
MNDNPYKSPETRAERRVLPRIGTAALVLLVVAAVCGLILLRLEFAGKPRSAQDAFQLWAASIVTWAALIASLGSGLLLLLLRLAGR